MRFPDKRAKVALTALPPIFLGIALNLFAQALTPGEVRLSSRPYIPQSPIRIQTRLVELEVVVRDNRGRPVPGLTKDDFIVYDAHKLRDITSFSVSSAGPVANALPNTPPKTAAAQAVESVPPVASTPPAPVQPVPKGRWIALFFDDLNTPAGDMIRAKVAANRFIKEAAAGGDRIALLTTSGNPIQNFSSDAAAILDAMTRVQSHPHMSPSGLAMCPRITPYEAYQILTDNPTAIGAKVQEMACCVGNQYNDLCKSGGGEPSATMAGRGPVAELNAAVRAQAEATWNQARVNSQSTLDAIKAAINQLASQQGANTRMLLLASSGFLSGTLDQQLDAIIDEAVSAGVVINSLDAKGLYAEPPGPPINEPVETIELPLFATVFQIRTLGDRLDSEDSAMARFAESTGGLLFRNNNDLDLGFRQLGVMPSITYLLGFPPEEDGEYHKIKVELKNAGRRIVLVRPGYFAPAKGSTEQIIPADTIDTEIQGSAEKTDFPVTITEKFAASAKGGSQLTIQSHVDIQKLAFQLQQDRQVQRLTFVAALFDLQGNFVTGKQAEMSLALKQESFDRLTKSGINGVMQLDAPAGPYRLRMVVQEAVHGAMSATTKEFQIP